MNKEDFFDLLDGAKEQFAKKNYEPKGVRLEFCSDYYDRHWKIWIVGPGSIDPTLVMATDTWPVKGKFTSKDRAEKTFTKYSRWFKEWKNENS